MTFRPSPLQNEMPRKPGPQTKSNETESARRIAAVRADLALCFSTAAICAKYSEAWGVTPRQVQNYLADAKAEMLAEYKALADESLPARRAQHRERLAAIVQGATAATKFEAALNAVRDIGKLDGVETVEAGNTLVVNMPPWMCPPPAAPKSEDDDEG